MDRSPHRPLTRAGRGRWVAGVCEGIARVRPIPVATLRAGFVLGTAFAGLGALVYLACWLIIPAEGETAGTPRRAAAGAVGPRAITSVILGCAALAGLATLGVLAAAATVFGFGWVVAVVAGAVLLGALGSWRRLGPAWALLPAAALILPSIALAASGVHVALQTGDRSYAPATLADLPAQGYESGFGRTLIDLRHTRLPSGDVHLRVKGGVRQTIVALPHDRCVAVDVDYHVHPFAARAASVLTGDGDPYETVSVFGDERSSTAGRTIWPGRATTAVVTTLHVDFTSQGGSLYVRDYPDSVDPVGYSGWPGQVVAREAKPIRDDGLTRQEYAQELEAWRTGVRQARRYNAHAERFAGGPCVAPKAKEGKR